MLLTSLHSSFNPFEVDARALARCIDGIDENDVLAFDVPADHSIDVTLTLDQAVTTFIDLTYGAVDAANYLNSG